MSSSAKDSPPSELRPEPAGLISTELELPVVHSADGTPPLPSVFAALWKDLIRAGWTAGDFSVVRDYPSAGPSISSNQAISTDTGPVIELVTSPSKTLKGIEEQMAALQSEARAALERHGAVMLGSGVHPGLRPIPADYYRYRTPRPAYDYAVNVRGWHHWTIVDKAAVQELVDVPFDEAPRAIRMLHRLTGLMNFVLRNDPGIHTSHDPRLSVRSLSWRSHVPQTGPFAADARRVVIPSKEIESWRDYLSLLWTSGPMFLVGTKNNGLAYVPEHPTFLEFISRAPRDGWNGRLLDGSTARVTPEIAHVAASDWSYMGFARIRWKWRPDPPSVEEIAAAWADGGIEALLRRSLEKVVIENRGTSTQPPGESLVSLALVAGLVANLDESLAFSLAAPYAFWQRVLGASTRQPLRGATVDGRSVPDLARDLIALSRRGLALRQERDPDGCLRPLVQRIDEGTSPAERRIEELRDGGLAAVVGSTRL